MTLIKIIAVFKSSKKDKWTVDTSIAKTDSATMPPVEFEPAVEPKMPKEPISKPRINTLMRTDDIGPIVALPA